MFGLPFHHVGIACRDIDSAALYVARAFHVSSDSGTVYDPLQNAQVRLFNAGTAGAIELVAGPVVATLLKSRTSYYHICYTAPDIVDVLRAAQTVGAILAGSPKPALLFDGRLVAFVYTPLGLVEFLEQR